MYVHQKKYKIKKGPWLCRKFDLIHFSFERQKHVSFLLYFLFPSSSLQKGGSSYQFVKYASVEILPSFASITDSQKQQNTLQLLAEGSCYVQPENDIELCLESLHIFLLVSYNCIKEQRENKGMNRVIMGRIYMYMYMTSTCN